MNRSIGFYLLLSSLLLVWACDNAILQPVPKRERTNIRFLHAHADLGSVNVNLSSYGEVRTVASSLSFLTGWPSQGYASVLVDTSETVAPTLLELVQSNLGGTLIEGKEIDLFPATRSTFAILDSFNKPLFVQTSDDFEAPIAGHANFRFMNLNHNLLSVSLKSSTDSVNIARQNFLNYSRFKYLPAGRYSFFFVDDFTGVTKTSILDLDIQAGKTYSFYLTHINGTAKAGVELLEQ
ncbi:MAG: hypothetical protein AAFR61_14365 [Bacteroidota bacterium]